jgi:hypothetical protein
MKLKALKFRPLYFNRVDRRYSWLYSHPMTPQLHFTKDQLIRFALIAEAGYLDNGSPALFQALAKVNVAYVDGASAKQTDTQAWVGQVKMPEGETTAFVVFRGTRPEKVKDILTDIRAFPKNHVFGTTRADVHQGFLDSVTEVAPKLLDILKTVDADHIYCVGHSWGGADAEIFSVIVAESGVANCCVNCISFEAPRVGLRSFTKLAGSLAIPTLRVRNSDDVVPSLPWGFEHVPAQELHLMSSGLVTKKWYSWAIRAWSLFKGQITNHFMSSVLASIERLP